MPHIEVGVSSGQPNYAALRWALDAWNEGDHPRGQPENAGQFGSGGGGSSSEECLTESEKKIAKLGQQRAEASKRGDWPEADEISFKMEELGWHYGDPIPGSKEWKVQKEEAKVQKEEARKKVPLTKERAEAVVDEVAKKTEFDVSKISVSGETKTFKLNERDYFYGGSCNLTTGEITVYNNHVSENTAAGLVVHEIEHNKFQTVLDAVRQEWDRVMERVREHDDVGKSRLEQGMKPDGSLREPLASEFPLYTKWHDAYSSKPVEDFSNSDGVSDYSAEYWKAWQAGQCSTDIAFHETLAEMARIKYETGEYPEHRWSPGAASSYQEKGRVVEKAKKVGAIAWRNLFGLVDEVYAERNA